MVEVHPRLWVGAADDYERHVRGNPSWRVVQACKDPYHRRALGYTGRTPPDQHPEYFCAYRDNRLILNMVDADDPKYFNTVMTEAALSFIDSAHHGGGRALVHCNQGLSRAPSLALLWLAPRLGADLAEARRRFTQLYPAYAPRPGVWGFVEQHWAEYHQRERG